MLLWVLILTLFGAMVAGLGRGMPDDLRATTLAVQACHRGRVPRFHPDHLEPVRAQLFPAPLEGRDLNPLLQDLGLAIHPPLLYLGYVGFSIVFSFAVGGADRRSASTPPGRAMSGPGR